MELGETVTKALLEINKNKQCIYISLLKVEIHSSEWGSPRTTAPKFLWFHDCSNNLKSNPSCYPSSHRRKRKKHFSPCPIQVGHCCFFLCSSFLMEVCQVLMWFTEYSKCWKWLLPKKVREHDYWAGMGYVWERHRLRFRSPLGRWYAFTGYLLFIGIHAFLWSFLTF